MADNTDDPIADVPPEQAAVPASAPVISSANGVLLIMFTHILVIIYYRAAWYALETLVFEKYPAIGQYSTFLLIPYLVPLAGMLASVVSSSPGALTAWTLAVVGVASSIMIASFFYVLVFDLPPSTIAFAMSLFRSPSSPPAPATA